MDYILPTFLINIEKITLMLDLGMTFLSPWVLTLICILVSPFLVLMILFVWFSEKKVIRLHKKFLNDLGDKNFFCYNDRSDVLKFIEQELLPKLANTIELVCVEGRTVKSAYDPRLIRRTLHILKNHNRFPHLLKIRNGEIINKSISGSLLNTIKQRQSINDLLFEIDHFFK